VHRDVLIILCIVVQRKIFGPKRNEITEESGKRNVRNCMFVLLVAYYWMIKPRIMKTGHVAHMGWRCGAYRVLVSRIEGKGPLGRFRQRWEEDIKNSS
jgi:hypothetical protein